MKIMQNGNGIDIVHRSCATEFDLHM